jgi:hypothetical protein
MWNAEEKYTFDFERLKVYEMGLEFIHLCHCEGAERPKQTQDRLGTGCAIPKIEIASCFGFASQSQ